jgi:uncharacterized protein YndB with AHSA1/START domain
LSPKRLPDPPPPIRRSVTVSWDQTTAFDRFTTGFATWWPSHSHSVGGPRVARIVFECRAGGRIYEEHTDGTRFRWGTVTAFEPPRRVAFTWHASYEATDAQQVDVTFVPQAGGTRVELVSSGWERMGGHARRSYGGYRLSWRAALGVYARQPTASLLFLQAMSTMISVTGQRGTFIRHSRGRMPPGGAT